jgi:hypothetical protein
MLGTVSWTPQTTIEENVACMRQERANKRFYFLTVWWWWWQIICFHINDTRISELNPNKHTTGTRGWFRGSKWTGVYSGHSKGEYVELYSKASSRFHDNTVMHLLYCLSERRTDSTLKPWRHDECCPKNIAPLLNMSPLLEQSAYWYGGCVTSDPTNILNSKNYERGKIHEWDETLESWKTNGEPTVSRCFYTAY